MVYEKVFFILLCAENKIRLERIFMKHIQINFIKPFKNLHLKYLKHFISISLLLSLLFMCEGGSILGSGICAGAETDFTKLTPLGVMATAVGRKIAVSWESVAGADGYEIYEARLRSRKDGTVVKTDFALVKRTSDCLYVFENKSRGIVYYYYVRAYKIVNEDKDGAVSKHKVVSKNSKEAVTTVAPYGKSTVKNFLRTAISPIGSTMYVWGGGWDSHSASAGRSARRIGLSKRWRSFAKKQTSSYNFSNHLYQSDDGLDCSGFVGWTIYNVMNTTFNQKGYVYFSRTQAGNFAGFGFGTLRNQKWVKNYKPGDIMSATCNCGECRHVWIVLGECEDGSVVLVHSTPSGVQISGTVDKNGKKKSEAYKLAKQYMETYYPSWTKRFHVICKDETYLTHYSQMRWTTTGEKAVLSDPDGYQNMSAEEVLADLFEEVEY